MDHKNLYTEDTIDELLTDVQTDAFQNITEIAAQICGTPSAMINFLDDENQWTLFNVGWKNANVPRKNSICQFTVEQDDLLHIPDTSQNHRLLDVQAVQDDSDIGFYAGINIKNKLGNKVGTLCVIDKKPRKLTKKQRKALKTLADDIEARLELIRSNVELEHQNNVLVNSSRFLKNSTDFKLILHPDSLNIEMAYPEVQGKLGYNPEEMAGTYFIEYCTNKEVAGSINKWIEQEKTEKLSIESGFSNKLGDQLCMSLQISMADNRLYVTGQDISKRKKVEKQLNKEKQMMEGIIQNLPGIFCLIDVHGTIKRWNRNLETITGYSGEELESSRIDKYLVEDDLSIAFQKLREIFKHERARNEFTIVSKNGEQTPILVTGFRHKIAGEFLAVVIGVSITDQKQAEQKLKKTLKEREVLLGEIHHRVKNNLAIISGIMQLELMDINDDQALSVLSNTIMRIKSIALVHEKLYTSDDFKNISLGEFVNDLLTSIESRSQFVNGSRIEKEIVDTKLNINLALPAGLLLNELISNAFKHAFPNKKSGVVDVKIRSHDDEITMIVADNGIGLPKEFNLENRSSVGFTLINVLSSQLMAEYSIDTDSGTRFTFTFKNQDKVNGASGNIFPS